MASCERNTPPLSLTSTSGTPCLRIAAYSTARYASVSCRREMAEARMGEVRAQRVILPCGRHVACTLPPKPGVPLVAAPGFPSPLTRILMLSWVSVSDGKSFQLCALYHDMTGTGLPWSLVGDRRSSVFSSIGLDSDDERQVSLLAHIVHTYRLLS